MANTGTEITKEQGSGSEETEALSIFETSLPAIADITIIALAEEAEKRLEALTKIKKVALKMTNAHDWVNENGKPYLQASGGEKIARLFGVSWRISEPVIENLEGGHFSITYKGDFALGGAIIQAIGTRSSKDPFFKKYKYVGEERERIELPASEIDKGDVKKSAYTNLLGNGITRLLGIRNLTWDDLKEFAHINQADVASVEFKKGGRQASQPSKAPSSQPTKQATKPGSDEPATESQAKAIHAQLGVLKVVDELAKMEKVAKILGLAKVPTAVTQITKAQASTVIQTLQKEIDNDNRESSGS